MKNLVIFFISFLPALLHAKTPEILIDARLEEKIRLIEPSPIPGVHTVTLKGGRVVYVSTDGRFLLEGRLIGKAEGGLVDLTAPIEARARIQALEELPPQSFITYRPKAEFRSYITVFTDVGCPFCQRFHSEVKALNEAGVGVSYLPYPRGGEHSEDFSSLLSVWCAKDPAIALDRALSRRSVSKAECAASQVVKTGFELGNMMGVKGTPAIILPNGQLITGYRDAKSVIEVLKLPN